MGSGGLRRSVGSCPQGKNSRIFEEERSIENCRNYGRYVQSA